MMPFRYLGGLSLLYCFATPPANAETISATDPRPVAAALDILEQRYGYVITYEDPVLVFPGDFTDVTEQVFKDRPDIDITKVKRIFGAKITTLAVDYEVGPDGLPLDPGSLVRSIATAGSVEGLRYDSVQSNANTFNVVAMAARDVTGKVVDVTPLLDTPISLPAKDRSADDFLEETCAAIAQQRSVFIYGADARSFVFSRARVTRGAANESARDVLGAVLASIDRQLSWRFLCEPGPDGGCMLNIYRVAPRETPPVPGARKAKPPRTRPHPLLKYTPPADK